VAVLAALVLAVGAAGAPVGAAHRPLSGPLRDDPVVRRARIDLAGFTSWLRANRAQGIVSEVGWPAGADAEAWNAVADAWYRDADTAGLWVTAWAAGPFAPDDRHQIYARSSSWPAGGVDHPTSQSAVVEAHPSTPDARRGVAVTGGSWGDGLHDAVPFSSAHRGTYGLDYFSETPATFAYLASRGLSLVRLDVKWERLQPTLGAPLDPLELTRLHDTIAAAAAAGLGVVLDLHNYGAYQTPQGRQPVGSAAVPVSAFTDLWSRLATALTDTPGVVAYGLMNEPHDAGGARAWERASQAAVRAIRATGDTHEIHVPGYHWSQVQTWVTEHPRAWIRDPLDRVRYDAHQYFDGDRSGRYALTYQEELVGGARG
jgi:Cellulase (glycosyl hydrolase family 5)